MRFLRVLPIAVLALCFASRVSAEENSAARSQIQAQYVVLAKAESALNAAMADPIVAPDFSGVAISGKKQDRAAYFSDNFVPSDGVSKIVARVTIDSFVLTGADSAEAVATADATFEYRPGGATVAQAGHLVQRERDTWALRAGKWQMTGSRVLDETQSLDGKMVTHQVAAVPLDPAAANAVVTQLDQVVYPLRTAVPEGSLDDLAPLASMIGTARIVGMGEGTHGTSEFFSMKDRIFRFLVQKMGFTVFAMEANWTDGRNIDDYVTNGHGDIRAALKSTFAVWDNQEVLDLLQWMRAYNAAPGKHATLHFVGIDLQSPMHATDMLETFYEQHAPSQAPQVKADYSCLHFGYGELYGQMSKASAADKAACAVKAGALYAQTVVASASLPDAERLTIVHAALVAKQAAAMYACNCGNDVRDAAMAENATWVAQALYPNARIALWAHNGHIAAAPMSYTPMGVHLRKTFGQDYYALGFTFDKGTVAFNGMNQGALGPAPDSSSAAIFRRVRYPLFLLDLQNVRVGTPLAQWLSEDRPVAMLGAVNLVATAENNREFAVPLPKTFDGLIFVEESHAAHAFQIVAQNAAVAPKRQRIPSGAGGRQLLEGWTFFSTTPNDYMEGFDTNVTHGTGPSIWVASSTANPQAFFSLQHDLDLGPYLGKRVRIVGFLKSKDVRGKGAFWMRVDQAGSDQALAFDNMHDRGLHGTQDWQAFSIVLDVPKNASDAVFGMLLLGTGQVWADDVKIGVVGTDVKTTAP